MSAILSVDDLNDFISPGVACIKPVETLPTIPDNGPSSSSQTVLENEVILDGQSSQPSTSKNAPAQISLTDCLACSGCVTSAEAVLVSLQSHAEVLSVLDSAPALRIVHRDAGSNGAQTQEKKQFSVEGLDNESARLFVASVSPQTRANLAAVCGSGVSAEQAGHMLDRLLMGPGGLAAGGRWGNKFSWVVDTSAAREACLVLGSDEVLGPAERSKGSKKKPILTSSCPGWVCYAEKTHPHVLPHLSRVKSPQALTGTLLKTTLSKLLGIPTYRIWHLAIMPCFDKKLEASREELTDTSWSDGKQQSLGPMVVRDVDCVITSKEVFLLTESRGIDFFSIPKTQLPPPHSFPDSRIHQFLFLPNKRRRPSRAAGSSGGNLHFILQDVLFRNPGSWLETTRGRNADVVEYAVVSNAGDISSSPANGGGQRPQTVVLFKAAKYYGFRNIQNLVRKLKPARPSRIPGGKPFRSTAGAAARRQTAKQGGAGSVGELEHAYIEVMACPGGCTNGGGQVKADDQVIVDRRGLITKPGPLEQRALLAEVDEAYFSSEEGPEEGPEVNSGHGFRGMESQGVAQTSEPPGAGDLVDGISPSYIRDTLKYWAGMTGLDLERLVYTSYREVISDVGKSGAGISDTERVVQLAGKIGGGW